MNDELEEIVKYLKNHGAYCISPSMFDGMLSVNYCDFTDDMIDKIGKTVFITRDLANHTLQTMSNMYV